MGDEDGPAEFTNADHLPPLLSGECISILAASCGRCISKMVSHPCCVYPSSPTLIALRPKYRFRTEISTKPLPLLFFNPLLEIYSTNNYSLVAKKSKSNLIKNWTCSSEKELVNDILNLDSIWSLKKISYSLSNPSPPSIFLFFFSKFPILSKWKLNSRRKLQPGWVEKGRGYARVPPTH